MPGGADFFSLLGFSQQCLCITQLIAALQPVMFGAAQAQSSPPFGAASGATPSFGFGQQPNNGQAPAFGQTAPTPAFGQANGGMASGFGGSFQSGVNTFAAGTTSNAPAARAPRRVVRKKR